MPSCDGSNCGACSACSTSTKTEYVHLDKDERRKYEKRIAKLEKELKEQKNINLKLIKKALDLDIDVDFPER